MLVGLADHTSCCSMLSTETSDTVIQPWTRTVCLASRHSTRISCSSVQFLSHAVCYLQMLENANEIILHGFAYKDFLRELPNPQVCLAAVVLMHCIMLTP